MDNQTQQEDLFDVEVDIVAKKHIIDIAIWAKIVAICAFVSYGILLITTFLGGQNSAEGFAASASRAMTISFVLVIVIIFVIINIFLLKFSIDAKNGVENNHQSLLENGFNSLRIYFKIIGILVIVMISLLLIVFLLARLGGSV